MTEKDKMIKGSWYNPGDKELSEERKRVKSLCFKINTTDPSEEDKISDYFSDLIPHKDKTSVILPPFQADYGYNISIGENSFINHNAYLLDCAAVTIGKNCFIGPDFGAYTALHPMDPEIRRAGTEKALPVVIEDDVWIGGSVKILPGVTIGRGSVIGAGSTVTRDIPPMSFAAGSPAEVIRNL